MMRYPVVKAGEWVQPRMRGYRMGCCDCGLVHVFDFRLVDGLRGAKRVQFRAFRNNKATNARRKRHGIVVRTTPS